jgi:hypothetical protein
MNADEWLSAYADKLGTDPPTQTEIDDALAVASVAAHASQRSAAPLACWMAAKAGVSLDQALALARSIAAEP